ncbi:MAG: DUF481 domain-containing protein [Candidatus Poribacteria bacterium]|nr:DUF481 domain-containing protein [Candidatus Poribacteria bacterium]
MLLTCLPVAAQVNIFTGETMKQMQLQPGWYNNLNLDLTYRTGNTELLTLRTRFRSDYLSKKHHSFIFGSLQQGRKDGVFFTNKGMVHGRIIRKLSNLILIESFIQKQFNESILLDDRNLIGGGIRFAVRSPKSRHNLYVGIGAMLEHENIKDDEIGNITTRIVRSTNYINWTARIDDRLSSSATGYYQVHVRHLADYRILFEGRIMVHLTTKLGIPLRVNFRYDNEPPTDIKKHDLELFNGLSYTF